jgi:hypothetical protein
MRGPVRRYNAQNYVLVTLISFAVAVIVTRLFLTLTGFPKIGSGELHIAHVLWGGLLLFLATLLLLVLANRWAYLAGAVLGGVGVGLFIDEVGKFITSNNDYFYPLAMPLIYAFCLIVVILYLQVRRPEARSARAEMYRIFEMLGEVLDRDLEPHERTDLLDRLRWIATQGANPDIARLAQLLLDYLSSDSLQLTPDRPDLLNRAVKWLQTFEARWLGPKRLKLLLVAGLALIGSLAAAEIMMMLIAPQTAQKLEETVFKMMQAGQIKGIGTFNWFIVRLAVGGSIGLLMLLSSFLFVTGQDQRASTLGYISLLLSLTIVNLVVFYFDQFGNVLLTLCELLLLIGIIDYRRAYLAKPAAQTVATAGH